MVIDPTTSSTAAADSITGHAGSAQPEDIARAQLTPKPEDHTMPRIDTIGGISVGSLVRIREGYVGAGYRFIVAELFDNRRAAVDPCVQVYGTNHYGPVRLSEIQAV